jgi:hypothetical protein
MIIMGNRLLSWPPQVTLKLKALLFKKIVK